MSSSRVTSKNLWLGIIVATVITAILYVSSIAQTLDGNALIEVIGIKAGGEDLISPNHLLYRPLVRALYDLMRVLGYEGSTLYPAQVFSALVSAIGVGFFFGCLQLLTKERWIAGTITLALATSWSQWHFSTDAQYVGPACSALIIALFILLQIQGRWHSTRLPIRSLALSGVFAGISVLIWQANVFFPFYVMCLLLVLFRQRLPTFLVATVIYLGVIGIVVGGCYALASIYRLGPNWSPEGMIRWLTNYGEGSSRLAIWGVFDLGRVPTSIQSAVTSIAAINGGLGISNAFSGDLGKGVNRLPSWLSLISFALLVILPLGYLLLTRRLGQLLRDWRFQCAIALYLVYLPFIIWWDPFEPKWFMFPNVGLWAAIGLSWAGIELKSWQRGLLLMLVALIGLGTFITTIGPKASQQDPNYAVAQCIAENTNPTDVNMDYSWAYSLYLDYFFDRRSFLVVAQTAVAMTDDSLIQAMREQFDETVAAGGRAYYGSPTTLREAGFLVDWFYYLAGGWTDDYLNQVLVGEPAFTCGSIDYLYLTSVNSVPRESS